MGGGSSSSSSREETNNGTSTNTYWDVGVAGGVAGQSNIRNPAHLASYSCPLVAAWPGLRSSSAHHQTSLDQPGSSHLEIMCDVTMGGPQAWLF